MLASASTRRLSRISSSAIAGRIWIEAPLRRCSASSEAMRASSVRSWLLTASTSFCSVAVGQALELDQVRVVLRDPPRPRGHRVQPVLVLEQLVVDAADRARSRPWRARCRAPGGPRERVASSLGLELLPPARRTSAGRPRAPRCGPRAASGRPAPPPACRGCWPPAAGSGTSSARPGRGPACCRSGPSCSARNSRRRRERSRAHCTLSDWNDLHRRVDDLLRRGGRRRRCSRCR